LYRLQQPKPSLSSSKVKKETVIFHPLFCIAAKNTYQPALAGADIFSPSPAIPGSLTSHFILFFLRRMHYAGCNSV
jgi:hypothetical protein